MKETARACTTLATECEDEIIAVLLDEGSIRQEFLAEMLWSRRMFLQFGIPDLEGKC